MSSFHDKVGHGDCVELLRTLPRKCASLVFADPPFNIGYRYDEYKDKLRPGEYAARTEQWLTSVNRVLKPDGSLYVAIGDEFAAEMKILIDQFLHYTMRNWIVWRYGFGQNCNKKFNRCHAHVLYYVKDPKAFTFNADAVRVASARQEVYGDARADARGKLPDDVWDIPRVCGTFKERTGHPCQMPEKLLERVILASSDEGDLVIDPFCGSGTTAAAAKRNGRHYYTCDVSAAYVKSAKERLTRIKPGLFT